MLNHNIYVTKEDAKKMLATKINEYTRSDESIKLYVKLGDKYICKKYSNNPSVKHEINLNRRVMCVNDDFSLDVYCCKKEQFQDDNFFCDCFECSQIHLFENLLDINLRPFQYNTVKILGRKKKFCLLLDIDTGMGKTNICLCFAYIKKLSTLIIVHNTGMKEQWEKQLFNLGINYKVQCIQGIKSMDYYSGYDLVIFDEVHKYISAVFVKCVISCDSQYIIGVSATPNKDYIKGVSPSNIFQEILWAPRYLTQNEYIRKLEILCNKEYVETPVYNG